MRILFLTLGRFPGPGASVIQVANMAQAFAELGHAVRLVAPAGPEESADGGAHDGRFGWTPAFETVPLSRNIHRGQSLLHAVRIAQMTTHGVDLVFSRNLRACLAPALRGIPTVFEAHTLTSMLRPQDRAVMSRLHRARGFRGIVAISQALADDLVEQLGVDPARILVAHDAVRLDVGVEPAALPPAPPGTIRVVYTGSLFAGRGIDLLLDLAEREHRVQVHLVGGPEEAARKLATVAAGAIAEGRLVIHGPVSPARARAFQRAADLLVAPFEHRVSTNEGVDSSRWMSPMKVFEYMASERPIVISDLPVLREVLRPDVDALMVPPEDPDALAAAVLRLADDALLRARLAASALERVRSEFTWELRARRILERLVPELAPEVEQDPAARIAPPSAGRAARILVTTLTPYPSGTAQSVHVTGTVQGLVDAGHRVLLAPAQAGPGWPDGDAPPDTSGFRVTPLAGSDHRGQSIVNGLRLHRLARRTRPDVAYADDVRSALAIAHAGVPVLLELHTMAFHTSRLGRVALARLLERPELRAVVTISRALRDDLLTTAGVPEGLMRVLPEAARARPDDELTAAAPGWVAAGMRSGALQVGYSGSLYEGRGVDLMVEVARRLPDIDLHVLGGPVDAADALRRRSDLPGNVRVHGLRTIADAERLQSSMDVLLAPYARSVMTPGGVDTSRWMSPMKVFGYLAAGRAVICSDLPVLREVLEDGVTALLVDPEDVDGWAAAVARLRDDPELRTGLAARGRARHAERFTWETRTRGLLEAWRVADEGGSA